LSNKKNKYFFGQGPYKVMTKSELKLSNFYTVRAVQPEEIEKIRKMRNSQIDVLRQSKIINFQNQINYFKENIWPDKKLKKPKNILLSIFFNDSFIGYGGLVHINWVDLIAEISFLLDPSIQKKNSTFIYIFEKWLDLVKRFAFDDLGLKKLTTETYSMRKSHISVLEKSNFQCEGILKDHIIIRGKKMDSVLHSYSLTDWKKNG